MYTSESYSTPGSSIWISVTDNCFYQPVDDVAGEAVSSNAAQPAQCFIRDIADICIRMYDKPLEMINSIISGTNERKSYLQQLLDDFQNVGSTQARRRNLFTHRGLERSQQCDSNVDRNCSLSPRVTLKVI